MTTPVQEKPVESALLNHSEVLQDPTTQKTSEMAVQIMQSANAPSTSTTTEGGNPHLFTRLAENGLRELLFSYSSESSTENYGKIVQELERRNQSGIPIMKEEHEHLLSLETEVCRSLTQRIHHLNLYRAFVNDEELEQIIGLYPNLRTLDLTNSLITNKGFALLKKLPLEKLDLMQCTKIYFDFQNGFSSLRRLNLRETLITDDELASLKGCPLLTHLNLGNCTGIQRMVGSGLDALAKAGIPLVALNLADNPRWHRSFGSSLEGFSQLRDLTLCGCSLTDGQLARFKRLKVTHLDLSENHTISDEGIRSIRKLPLETLILNGCTGISDEGFVSLQSMPLQHLNLEECNITDDGLEVLVKALPLRSLNLKYCLRLTDRGIRWLVLLPLETLKLDGCTGISDEGFNALGDLPLRTLSVSHSEITENSLKTLAEKLYLTSLNISFCKNLGQQGLKCLRLLPLERLITNEPNPALLRERTDPDFASLGQIPGLDIIFV